MKNTKIQIVILAVISASACIISACTYQAVAVSSLAPTSEIRADRFRDTHVGVVTNMDSTDFLIEAKKPGFTCTAHTYPVDVGPALRESIGKVMDASFSSYENIGSVTARQDGKHGYVMIFDLEEFDATFSYSTGFWSGTAHGRASITLKVTILDSYGDEILRTNVSGDGNGDAEGGCGKGAEALGQAASEAVAEVLENFVYKVINSDQLDKPT